MEVKEWGQGAVDGLEDLAAACGEDSPVQIQGLLFIYTAREGDRLTGAVYAWKNKFHSQCTYFRLLLSPGQEGLQTAGLLYSRMKERTKGCLLQTSVWETSGPQNAFLKNSGFKEVRRTYMPVLALQKVELSRSLSRQGLHAVSLREYPSSLHEKQQLQRLVKQNYIDTHQANPPGDVSEEVWEQLIFAEDLIADCSFVALDQLKGIRAYSFLHETHIPGRAELGWCGTSPDEKEATLRSLVRLQANAAASAGFTELSGEFDTTSRDALVSLASLPFPQVPAWLTYQKQL